MKIVNKIWTIGLMAVSMTFTACEDFFETDPKNIINEEDYIAEEDEMYKGFLGIFNRMQEAGDHAIFLTDTRAALLETTDNAPTDLKAICNYDETYGNPYADPTCYYAIIVACNDYFAKMEEFHQTVGGMTEIAEENFPALASSAMRIKAWAYLMLGKIYGEAYWFDDPLTEKKDLNDASVFTRCNMKELADRAIDLLENGMTIDGIHVPANLDVKWYKWLDPEVQDQTKYRQWQFLTPPAVILNAEFRSWRASYVDEEAAQADWAWIRENILDYFYYYQQPLAADVEDPEGYRVAGGTGYNRNAIFQLSLLMQSDNFGCYSNIFFTEETGSQYHLISTIMYDHARFQRNRLVQYFCPEYPDAESFYLQPSEYGVNLYNDTDIRGATQKWMINTLGGKRCVSKYYYGYNFTTRSYQYLDEKPIFEIQPAIPTFRGHDLHYLLAEAELHLGHYEQAYTLLNAGVSDAFPDKIMPLGEGSNWDERYLPWLANSGGYGNAGLAGAANGTMHDLPHPDDADWDSYTEDEIKKMYDWALADEHMKEYIAEGKSYSYMCKIAERYANSAYRNGNPDEARDSVAARIAPKYAPMGRQGTVENRIKSDGYFINWDLTGL
ncbi:MAG: hypothetical protein IJA00_09000 [Bacteroidaceae bacterium]|nr:hypothetical protein [Bacteroidaceae bacterium]MBQ4622617.1 hypothetical protein [Bacteroidaceae bacterium]MBQ6801363.1 hypothetical protein [Bacteroidaceae bacterium]